MHRAEKTCLELTSDAADFKGTQEAPKEANLPTVTQEVYFMAKDPGKRVHCYKSEKKNELFLCTREDRFPNYLPGPKQNIQTPYAGPEGQRP